MSSTPTPSLRIAMVAPPWFEIPPNAYGGIEWICAWLAEGLLARGHDVTLIAAGRDRTRARFLQTFPDCPSERLGDGLPDVIHTALTERLLQDLQVDLVHDHTLCGPLQAGRRAVPTFVTAHGPLAGDIGDYYRALGNAVNLVSISGSQRAEAPELNWAATVHNGIPVEEYPYRKDKEDYLLFLGRMSPDKGAHLAIDAARSAGRPLVIAGKCNEPPEKAYFDEYIAPKLGPDITWIGQVDAGKKKELMGGAHAFLFPIRWSEPFGIVMVEAMACGTPVVALRGGAVDEVVHHGMTGFVSDDPAELPELIDRAGDISPAACRAHALNNFDIGKMVEGYEKAYIETLERRSRLTAHLDNNRRRELSA
ncbi:glycosyltransferase family 4 protein [soil metagenome]